jgi:hypothetical protein
MSKKKNSLPEVTAFIDSVGRVVIGRITKQTSDVITVLNPGVVNIQVQQDNNQLAVQLLPFFFQEFTSENSKKNGVHWTFNANSVVLSEDIELDDNIKQQYASIFEGTPSAAAAPIPGTPATTPGKSENSAEVVKLFDE